MSFSGPQNKAPPPPQPFFELLSTKLKQGHPTYSEPNSGQKFHCVQKTTMQGRRVEQEYNDSNEAVSLRIANTNSCYGLIGAPKCIDLRGSEAGKQDQGNKTETRRSQCSISENLTTFRGKTVDSKRRVHACTSRTGDTVLLKNTNRPPQKRPRFTESLSVTRASVEAAKKKKRDPANVNVVMFMQGRESTIYSVHR